MKRMIAMAIFAATLLVGCNEQEQTADDRMNQQQEQMSSEGNRIVGGLPNVKNFFRKKTVKAIIEAVDNDKLINYAYMMAEGTGKLVYLGRCQGYAISSSTQYTNPQKAETYSGRGSWSIVTLPQADPDGLFSPSSAEGSWLLLIDPATNEPKATYFEPRLIVSPFPLNPKY